MKIEMDSAPTINKPGQLKQKAQAPIGQTGRVHQSEQWKIPEAHSNCPSQIWCSPLSIKNSYLCEWIKWCNARGSTKSLQRSYSVESMNSNTECIVASLDLEGITNNKNTWNHLAVCKQISTITF